MLGLRRKEAPELELPESDDPVHLRIRDLRKSYGEDEIIRGVSFDVFRDKTNLIIGPSGSGKTVLMRQIIRLEQPDSGQILLDGLDVAPLQGFALDRIRRRFGMVFQQSALFDSMTVFDNVAFPLREHTRFKRKEIRERVMARLQDLGIQHSWRKMPSELSGGMQKRVAVARALVLETDVLIYDEPTTGLDPTTARAVDDLIVEAQDKFGVTSIVISHDMASVLRTATYVTFLYFGRVLVSGGPDEFLSSDQPELRDFLSSSGVTIPGQ